MILHTNNLISAVDSSFLYSVACSGSGNNEANNSEVEEASLLVEALSFSIYPVPNSGSFTVKAPQAIQNVQILDLNGKLLQEIKEVNSKQLVVNSNLNSGIYFIKVILEINTTETLRFVIE